MKLKHLCLALALLFPSFAFAAEAEVKPVVSPQDALLTFVLDKAKSYSGTIESAISKAVDVAKEEAPALVKEYLTWKAWEAGIYGFAPIPFLIFFVLIAGYGWNHVNDGESAWIFVSTLFGSIGVVVSFAITAVNVHYIMDFIQIQVAPRIYIVEQAIHLIKK